MIFILFFLLLTYFMLTYPSVSLHYAFYGLTLWYNKMIPSLLPFMILSGTMIQMHLSEKFVSPIHIILKKIYRCRPNVSYGIVMGFLCGFPMGAKVTSQLLSEGKITQEEAGFLLSFCNNIGPIYFCTYVIPMLKLQKNLFPIIIMYGLPLLYGLILRYTLFRRSLDESYTEYRNSVYDRCAVTQAPVKFFDALDNSIKKSIGSISMLCGYMIFFNLLNILPHIFLPTLHSYIAPILEITGGIAISENIPAVYILILLPFGGLSCIAQTNSMIQGTFLSIKEYMFHKLLLSTITLLVYSMIYFIA